MMPPYSSLIRPFWFQTAYSRVKRQQHYPYCIISITAIVVIMNNCNAWDVSHQLSNVLDRLVWSSESSDLFCGQWGQCYYHPLWQIKDGCKLFDTSTIRKWGILPLPSIQSGLCDCFDHRSDELRKLTASTSCLLEHFGNPEPPHKKSAYSKTVMLEGPSVGALGNSWAQHEVTPGRCQTCGWHPWTSWVPVQLISQQRATKGPQLLLQGV